MKFVEIYETQKTTRPVVICRLGWDRKNRRIIPLLNAGYAKRLFEGEYLNKVTMERVPPTHSLKFLKSLHNFFLNLSYVRASKLKSAPIAYSTASEGALDAKPAAVRGGKMLAKWKVPFVKIKL